MIQAINELITHLDKHLKEHLTAYPQVRQDDVEAGLVEIFKEELPPSQGSFFSGLFSFKTQPSASHLSNSSISPSVPPIDSSNSSGTVPVPAPVVEGASLGWQALFDLQNIDLNDARLQAQSNGTETDNLKLRFNLTWANLMTANGSDFEKYLMNSLSGVHVTELKMIVVARLKRQLFTLAEKAKEELRLREQLYFGNNEIRFEINVDDWLVAVAQKKVAEAKILLAQVLQSKQWKLQAPIFSGLSVGMGPQAKTSEVIVETCGLLLIDFLAFCKKANINRTQGNPLHVASMIDVFPTRYNTKTPLMIINETAANYVLKNLFDSATYRAYTISGVSLPWGYYYYDLETAKDKRNHVLGALEVLDKVVVGKNDRTLEFWRDIFDKYHEMQGNGVRIQSPSILSKFASVINAKPEPKLTKMYREIHQGLVTNAPDIAQTVVAEHRECRI